MGEGGNVALINATNYTWVQTNLHSYQMNAWNFPSTIPPGGVVNMYVEWNTNPFITRSDDGGEVNYTLQGTNYSFQLQARAGNGFNLSVVLLTISTQGNPQGSTINLGWSHNGIGNFVLSGTNGNFTSTNLPSASWMQSNLNLLGNRTLKQLCMPGSHDAGMSTATKKTAFAFDCNILTQSNSIGGQLGLGSRFFDIRPIIGGGQYYTGHYSNIGQISSWQGARGQSIDSVIADINAFTAINKELIILDLSHDYNTDAGNSGYPSFTQPQWYGLLDKLKGINFLYQSQDTNIDLSSTALNTFIGNNAAVIVVIENNSIDLSPYLGKGFYTSANLNIYNNYADSNSLDTMANDQFTKMKNNSDLYFLLSWTLTQDNNQAVTCQLGTAYSIQDLANIANPQLSNMLMAQCTQQSYPNIILTDYVTDSNAAVISMAINSYFA